LVLQVAPAQAQVPQKWHRCANDDHIYSLDQQIAFCTSIIQSRRETPRDLAAYNNRGSARRLDCAMLWRKYASGEYRLA
jgi:hypothetical protein